MGRKNSKADKPRKKNTDPGYSDNHFAEEISEFLKNRRKDEFKAAVTIASLREGYANPSRH